MIDINELRRLAQAALAAPDGLSAEWMDRLGQFQEAADASVISELLDRLETAEKERDGLRHCFNEWIDKTEWMQRGINEGTISPKYLGLHRADVMASLLGAAEKERDTLRAKIEEAEKVESALSDLLNDLEERAKWNLEASQRVVACGNGVYVRAKAALEKSK